MGKVWFPLQNTRRFLDGSFNLKHVTGEQITVTMGATGFLGHAFLQEVPAPSGLDGQCLDPILTPTGLSRVKGFPATGEYFINYNSGEILFNQSESGKTYQVEYWGRGSLIEADDINALWRAAGLTDTGTYQVGNPTAWGDTAPSTISEAIDRLRSECCGSGSGSTGCNLTIKDHNEIVEAHTCSLDFIVDDGIVLKRYDGEAVFFHPIPPMPEFWWVEPPYPEEPAPHYTQIVGYTATNGYAPIPLCSGGISGVSGTQMIRGEFYKYSLLSPNLMGIDEHLSETGPYCHTGYIQGDPLEEITVQVCGRVVDEWGLWADDCRNIIIDPPEAPFIQFIQPADESHHIDEYDISLQVEAYIDDPVNPDRQIQRVEFYIEGQGEVNRFDTNNWDGDNFFDSLIFEGMGGPGEVINIPRLPRVEEGIPFIVYAKCIDQYDFYNWAQITINIDPKPNPTVTWLTCDPDSPNYLEARDGRVTLRIEVVPGDRINDPTRIVRTFGTHIEEDENTHEDGLKLWVNNDDHSYPFSHVTGDWFEAILPSGYGAPTGTHTIDLKVRATDVEGYWSEDDRTMDIIEPDHPNLDYIEYILDRPNVEGNDFNHLEIRNLIGRVRAYPATPRLEDQRCVVEAEFKIFDGATCLSDYAGVATGINGAYLPAGPCDPIDGAVFEKKIQHIFNGWTPAPPPYNATGPQLEDLDREHQYMFRTIVLDNEQYPSHVDKDIYITDAESPSIAFKGHLANRDTFSVLEMRHVVWSSNAKPADPPSILEDQRRIERTTFWIQGPTGSNPPVEWSGHRDIFISNPIEAGDPGDPMDPVSGADYSIVPELLTGPLYDDFDSGVNFTGNNNLYQGPFGEPDLAGSKVYTFHLEIEDNEFYQDYISKDITVEEPDHPSIVFTGQIAGFTALNVMEMRNVIWETESTPPAPVGLEEPAREIDRAEYRIDERSDLDVNEFFIPEMNLSGDIDPLVAIDHHRPLLNFSTNPYSGTVNPTWIPHTKSDDFFTPNQGFTYNEGDINTWEYSEDFTFRAWVWDNEDYWGRTDKVITITEPDHPDIIWVEDVLGDKDSIQEYNVLECRNIVWGVDVNPATPPDHGAPWNIIETQRIIDHVEYYVNGLGGTSDRTDLSDGDFGEGTDDGRAVLRNPYGYADPNDELDNPLNPSRFHRPLINFHALRRRERLANDPSRNPGHESDVIQNREFDQDDNFGNSWVDHDREEDFFQPNQATTPDYINALPARGTIDWTDVRDWELKSIVSDNELYREETKRTLRISEPLHPSIRFINDLAADPTWNLLECRNIVWEAEIQPPEAESSLEVQRFDEQVEFYIKDDGFGDRLDLSDGDFGSTTPGRPLRDGTQATGDALWVPYNSSNWARYYRPLINYRQSGTPADPPGTPNENPEYNSDPDWVTMDESYDFFAVNQGGSGDLDTEDLWAYEETYLLEIWGEDNEGYRERAQTVLTVQEPTHPSIRIIGDFEGSGSWNDEVSMTVLECRNALWETEVSPAAPASTRENQRRIMHVEYEVTDPDSLEDMTFLSDAGFGTGTVETGRPSTATVPDRSDPATWYNYYRPFLNFFANQNDPNEPSNTIQNPSYNTYISPSDWLTHDRDSDILGPDPMAYSPNHLMAAIPRFGVVPWGFENIYRLTAWTEDNEGYRTRDMRKLRVIEPDHPTIDFINDLGAASPSWTVLEARHIIWEVSTAAPEPAYLEDPRLIVHSEYTIEDDGSGAREDLSDWNGSDGFASNLEDSRPIYDSDPVPGTGSVIFHRPLINFDGSTLNGTANDDFDSNINWEDHTGLEDFFTPRVKVKNSKDLDYTYNQTYLLNAWTEDNEGYRERAQRILQINEPEHPNLDFVNDLVGTSTFDEEISLTVLECRNIVWECDCFPSDSQDASMDRSPLVHNSNGFFEDQRGINTIHFSIVDDGDGTNDRKDLSYDPHYPNDPNNPPALPEYLEFGPAQERTTPNDPDDPDVGIRYYRPLINFNDTMYGITHQNPEYNPTNWTVQTASDDFDSGNPDQKKEYTGSLTYGLLAWTKDNEGYWQQTRRILRATEPAHAVMSWTSPTSTLEGDDVTQWEAYNLADLTCNVAAPTKASFEDQRFIVKVEFWIEGKESDLVTIVPDGAGGQTVYNPGEVISLPSYTGYGSSAGEIDTPWNGQDYILPNLHEVLTELVTLDGSSNPRFDGSGGVGFWTIHARAYDDQDYETEITLDFEIRRNPYVPHFNRDDGQFTAPTSKPADALIDDEDTYTGRRIAQGADTKDYSVGDWSSSPDAVDIEILGTGYVAGSLHDGILDYQTHNPCLFDGDGTNTDRDTTFTVRIWNGPKVVGSPDNEWTTAVITGNGSYTTGTNDCVTVNVTNWGSNEDRFKGSVEVIIDLNDTILQHGGRGTVEILHNNGEDPWATFDVESIPPAEGPNYIQEDFFYEVEDDVPVMDTLEFHDEPSMTDSNYKWVSGVKYAVHSESRFVINAILDDLNDETYPPDPLAMLSLSDPDVENIIYYSGSVPVEPDIDSTELSNWSRLWNQQDSTWTTTMTYTDPASDIFRNVPGNTWDYNLVFTDLPLGVDNLQNGPVRIITYNNDGGHTATSESFNDDFDISDATLGLRSGRGDLKATTQVYPPIFTSSTSKELLTSNYRLAVIDGTLSYPYLDYTSIWPKATPGGLDQPDYSDLAGMEHPNHSPAGYSESSWEWRFIWLRFTNTLGTQNGYFTLETNAVEEDLDENLRIMISGNSTSVSGGPFWLNATNKTGTYSQAFGSDGLGCRFFYAAGQGQSGDPYKVDSAPKQIGFTLGSGDYAAPYLFVELGIKKGSGITIDSISVTFFSV